eukprot:832794-Rhodomonas_salina.1
MPQSESLRVRLVPQSLSGPFEVGARAGGQRASLSERLAESPRRVAGGPGGEPPAHWPRQATRQVQTVGRRDLELSQGDKGLGSGPPSDST